MRVAVIGPTGYSGSHTCVELLNRGYEVSGISRNPEKLGTHHKYKPIRLDVNTASIEQLVEAFKGFDVLVNGYNPPPTANLYKNFIETTRKIIIAAKGAKVDYFIMVGGTGSLEIPGEPYKTSADSREWWLAYRRAVADSKAATQHGIDRVGPGPMAEGVKAYRDARIAVRAGKATDADHQAIKDVEDNIKNGENWIPDLPVAARATYLMFENDKSFQWCFVSPSARFRPGPRTGKYDVYLDELPMSKESKVPSADGNPFEGRLLGISAADLAVAIVDEAEKREKVGRHWSAVSEWEDDEPYPTTITL